MTDILLVAIHQPDGTWEVEPEGNLWRGVSWGVLLSLPFWGGFFWVVEMWRRGAI